MMKLWGVHYFTSDVLRVLGVNWIGKGEEMRKRDCYEFLMWSDGYEGRLWEWRSGTWRVLEYYNFRHTFEECEITAHDITLLREHLGLSDSDIPDSKVLRFSPEGLPFRGETVST